MNNSYSVYLTNNITNSNNNFIVFSLNNKFYAINIQYIKEIINIPKLEIPSTTPKGTIGIFNYNGTIIKVIDLCPFLGFDTSNFSINDQLLIINFYDNYFAVHTEKIETITQLEEENIQQMPYKLEHSLLKKIYKTDNDSINIIDIEMLSELINDENLPENTINYENLFPSDEKSHQIMELRLHQTKTVQGIFSFPINANSINQYILFKLDNNNYYIDLKHVKEFVSIKRLNITKLPYTQDFIKGIINLKGNFLIVLDLKRFLNNNINSIEEGSKLIIIEGKNFNIALLVDEIKSIKNLKDINNTKTYSGTSSYIASEFIEDDQLFSIINIEKIISDERLYINIC